MSRFPFFKTAILFSATIATSSFCYAAGEKWYHVEVLVIESKDKSALAEEWPLDPGKPSLANAIIPSNEPGAELCFLNDNQLTLGRAKKRLQQSHRLIMHKGWRQMLSEKQAAQTIHLSGGQSYSDNNEPEVNGIIKLSTGRYLNVDADLVFNKPMKLVANGPVELGTENTQTTAHFVEVQGQDWKNDPTARLQSFRLKESSRLKADEMHYIDHPLYGIIIVVSPEKTST
ncbi:MAG: CsiV family protein [Candidatus Berkiella sp.]